MRARTHVQCRTCMRVRMHVHVCTRVFIFVCCHNTGIGQGGQKIAHSQFEGQQRKGDLVVAAGTSAVAGSIAGKIPGKRGGRANK